jgi:hypothetical protein
MSAHVLLRRPAGALVRYALRSDRARHDGAARDPRGIYDIATAGSAVDDDNQRLRFRVTP